MAKKVSVAKKGDTKSAGKSSVRLLIVEKHVRTKSFQEITLVFSTKE